MQLTVKDFIKEMFIYKFRKKFKISYAFQLL